MMRIITGRARGVRLSTLAGEATRPTSERAKEAIFSMLQFSLQGARVLDLFAGSGQMALEAVSRGAAHAVLCDASREAVGVIRENVTKTRLADFCEVVPMEFTAYLRTARVREPFDLVFLDPPYAKGMIPEALRLLLSRGLLSPNATVVCESADSGDVFAADEALASHFTVLKQARYGIAHVTLLRYCAEEVEA